MRQKGIVIKSIHGLIYFGKEKLSLKLREGKEGESWFQMNDFEPVYVRWLLSFPCNETIL